jgi:hypothetical protein
MSKPPAAISIAVWKPSERTLIFGQWNWGRFIDAEEALDVPMPRSQCRAFSFLQRKKGEGPCSSPHLPMR